MHSLHVSVQNLSSTTAVIQYVFVTLQQLSTSTGDTCLQPHFVWITGIVEIRGEYLDISRANVMRIIIVIALLGRKLRFASFNRRNSSAACKSKINNTVGVYRVTDFLVRWMSIRILAIQRLVPQSSTFVPEELVLL